ncbi:MAG: transporter substrate-binding domain-containing protein [Eubacterium sp.]|nr:transporter substrate-binding domain-containing protein [Eubacterium sp.]
MKIFTTVKRKLKRVAAAGLVGAVLVTSLTGCGKKDKTEDGVKTINVGVITAGDKTSFVDDKGKLTGYEIELMRKIDEELPQYKFNFVQLEGPTLFSSLDAKKVDMISGNFRRSDAREEKYYHTYRAYISTPYRIIVFEDNTDINSIKDLEGRKVGTGEGSLMADILSAYIKENDSKIEVVYSTDLVADLVSGRIEAIIFPGRQVDLYNASYDDLKFKAVGDPVVGSDGCMKDSNAYWYFRKTDEDVELRDAVSEALYKLRKDGVLKELSLEWYGTDLTEGIDEECEEEVKEMYGIK